MWRQPRWSLAENDGEGRAGAAEWCAEPDVGGAVDVKVSEFRTATLLSVELCVSCITVRNKQRLAALNNLSFETKTKLHLKVKAPSKKQEKGEKLAIVNKHVIPLCTGLSGDLTDHEQSYECHFNIRRGMELELAAISVGCAE